jgi:hypothetical protein
MRITPGSYYLKASSISFKSDLYYDNTADKGSATAVTVAPGNDMSGVNFRFSTGSSRSRISGTVSKDSDGSALSSAQISVYSSSGILITTAVSDSSGRYSVTGLSTGSYFLKAYAGAGFRTEYYYNASSLSAATAISIGNGSDVSNIDFRLSSIRSISGKVTRDKDGGPLAEIEVSVFANFNEESRANALKSRTNATGEYSFSNLAPGKYYVAALDNLGYIDEYYNNSSELGAMPVEVVQDVETTNINLGLATGGALLGKATQTSDGLRIAYPKVFLYSANWDLAKTIYGNSDGEYRSDVKPGSYYLMVSASNYADQYYPGSNMRNGASLVQFDLEHTTVVNFELNRGIILSGKIIRDSDGTGIPMVAVNAYNYSGDVVASAVTSTLGEYSISGILYGDYCIGTSNTPGFVDEYYGNVYKQDDAAVVTITDAVERRDINISLGTGGSISGKVVRDSDKTGIANIEVRAQSGSSIVKSTVTDSNGIYFLSGIAPGNYYLQTHNSAGYDDEYYLENQQTPIAVAANAETGNINFSLAAGWFIQGTIVRDSDGSGIQGVLVIAYNTEWKQIGMNTTNASGEYKIKLDKPGDYYLRTFNSIGYKDEFIENANTAEKATKVNVNEGTRIINFTLESIAEDLFNKMLEEMNSE